MLVANFSLGILGGILAIIGLLPLVSIIVEPAKILFLNNAINHGVLSPLGIAQAATAGKSVLFMVETNPGPGFGILTAYLLFGPRRLRPTVPGAMVIQFLGGIHEIYFPYVLMKPRLILAAILGGMSGIGTALIFGVGLVAPPAPGSIFAYLAVTPRGNYFGVLAAVVVAAAVSFAVASVLLGFGRNADPDDPEPGHETDDGTASDPGLDADGLDPLEESPAAAVPAAVPDAVPTGAAAAGAAAGAGVTTSTAPSVNGKDVRKLIVACDAGMGSSVMLASQMRKKLKP
jgi:PTS system mannitol-specific IIC component